MKDTCRGCPNPFVCGDLGRCAQAVTCSTATWPAATVWGDEVEANATGEAALPAKENDR